MSDGPMTTLHEALTTALRSCIGETGWLTYADGAPAKPEAFAAAIIAALPGAALITPQERAVVEAAKDWRVCLGDGQPHLDDLAAAVDALLAEEPR
jgi:hypothetical protein